MELEANTQPPPESPTHISHLPSANNSIDDLSSYSKKINKKMYLKLDKAQLRSLKDSFMLTEYYPKKVQINRLAKELNIDVTKIENWLKYERRKLSKLTFLQKYKKRKRFSEADLKFLKNTFETNQCPSKHEIENMAQKIHCSSKNVENWFGNYKKKVKNQNKTPKTSSSSPINTSKEKETTTSNSKSPILKEIKLEEASTNDVPTLDPQPKIAIPAQPNTMLNGINLESMIDPMAGFYDNLRNYMSSPDVVEMQKKNMALTQNFMIYQHLFQTYLMINFKKRLETTNENANNIKKEDRRNPLEEGERNMMNEKSKMPLAMQNMINFINNNLKERETEVKK